MLISEKGKKKKKKNEEKKLQWRKIYLKNPKQS